MLSLLIAMVLAAPAAGQTAASQETAVMAVVNQFVGSFNKGDAKAAAASCAAETSIIDDFPPHEWRGTGACSKWASDFDAFAKKSEITDGLVTLGKPRHVDITGDRAYVVVPADFVYKDHGKAAKQTGSTFTLVLLRGAAGWRITAWSWAKS
jgi:ketosteroid isomerase-like protein